MINEAQDSVYSETFWLWQEWAEELLVAGLGLDLRVCLLAGSSLLTEDKR